MVSAIRVNDLGKCYRLAGGPRASYRTLRESLVEAARARLRRWRAGARSDREAFWALRDVGFEVGQGEVLGIIGRNGAGKSTLLKILSRITKPTTGRVELRGRVGSLLEVGTGFHPELTGRENVFLNGAILGMSRREIARKFDAITAFAGVDQFLDTPVKRYSSGMYVRLAFAVAAHLEPEILLVDEVLAVGDQEFQKKCLGKMSEISRTGRTVLFVSHNMAAVVNLCRRALLIDKGRIAADGEPREVAARYLTDGAEACRAEYDLAHCPGRRKSALPLFRRVRLLNAAGQPSARFFAGDTLGVELDLELARPLAAPQVGIGFDNGWGQRVCSVATYLSRSNLPALRGRCRVRCHVPELPLLPGTYTLSLSVGHLQDSLLDQIENTVALEVLPADFFGNGRLETAHLGGTLVRSSWSVVDRRVAEWGGEDCHDGQRVGCDTHV
jgi:lipopolysaccharide transport system ATP-binding protein